MNQGTCHPLMDRFHGLRSSLRDPASGIVPRVISVLSATKSEGKTTVAACLAMSFAGQGQRVAILETNFRNPGLSDFFSMSGSPGIAEFLQGNAGMEEIVKEVSGIHVAFAGVSTVADPLDLLETPEMGKLVDTMKKDHSVIILDNPPVNDYRDGIVTARYADFIIYVVAYGMASKEIVVETLGLLGDKRIGIVMNRGRN